MMETAKSVSTVVAALCVAISMCGCVSYVCVGTPTREVDDDQLQTHVEVPITVVDKPAKCKCKDGLKIEGAASPADVNLLWLDPVRGEQWVPGDGHTYTADNAGQLVKFEIDVDALKRRVRGRLGSGKGPYDVDIPVSPAFTKGRDLGLSHKMGQLRTYRLLVELFKSYPSTSQTSKFNRDEFLRGFSVAYGEPNASPLAEKVEKMLRLSLSHAEDSYVRALANGKGYMNNEVTDAQIRNMVVSSVSEPGGELSVKAGFIEGVVQAQLDQNHWRLTAPTMSTRQYDSASNWEPLYEGAELTYLSFVRLRKGAVGTPFAPGYLLGTNADM